MLAYYNTTLYLYSPTYKMEACYIIKILTRAQRPIEVPNARVTLIQLGFEGSYFFAVNIDRAKTKMIQNIYKYYLL